MVSESRPLHRVMHDSCGKVLLGPEHQLANLRKKCSIPLDNNVERNYLSWMVETMRWSEVDLASWPQYWTVRWCSGEMGIVLTSASSPTTTFSQYLLSFHTMESELEVITTQLAKNEIQDSLISINPEVHCQAHMERRSGPSTSNKSYAFWHVQLSKQLARVA